MEHSEFVQGWKDGKLAIDVDRGKALQLAGSNMLPKRYQVAHMFWSWVWILSIPAALAVMFLYKWWAGLVMLVFVTPLLSKSTKTAAFQFMIDHSIENPDFYQFALSQGVIRVRQKQS